FEQAPPLYPRPLPPMPSRVSGRQSIASRSPTARGNGVGSGGTIAVLTSEQRKQQAALLLFRESAAAIKSHLSSSDERLTAVEGRLRNVEKNTASAKSEAAASIVEDLDKCGFDAGWVGGFMSLREILQASEEVSSSEDSVGLFPDWADLRQELRDRISRYDR